MSMFSTSRIAGFARNSLLLVAISLVAVTSSQARAIDFTLDTGSNDSFTAVSTTVGTFAPNTIIPVTETPNGNGTSLLEFNLSGGLPSVEFALEQESFEFTILPASRFTLTANTVNGEINEGLTDPLIPVLVERFTDNPFVPSSTETVMMPISTGTLTLQNCGGNQMRTGLPIDGVTGDVLIRGIVCLSIVSLPVTFQFRGTLPVMLPLPANSLLAGTALLSLGALAGWRRRIFGPRP